jgi:predicted small metal-binding protein
MSTTRTVVDCHLFPADIECEFTASADEVEGLELAVQHAVQAHGYRDTPALRERLRSMLHDESARKAAPEAESGVQ